MKVFLVLLFVDLFLHACSIIIGVDVLIQVPHHSIAHSLLSCSLTYSISVNGFFAVY